jgi:hypothetical protein
MARAKTRQLRALLDKEGRREICVSPDPTDESDPLDACPAHASAKRAFPPLDNN